MGTVKIEGKEVALDDAIINAGIPAIKAALSVDFPDVENADVQIVTPTKSGGPRTATVVKRGTGKGNDPHFAFVSGRSIQSKGKSVRQHLEENAQHCAQELCRRIEAQQRPGVVVELAKTSCTCGDSHPDEHWLFVIGGPFEGPEHALRALEDVVRERARMLKSNQYLSASDITGAKP